MTGYEVILVQLGLALLVFSSPGVTILVKSRRSSIQEATGEKMEYRNDGRSELVL